MRFLLLAAALLVGCSPAADDPDANSDNPGECDAGVCQRDAGETDTSRRDTGATVPADAGPRDAATAADLGADASQPPVDLGPERTAVFVAQGHMGRTTVSCDDGQSWVADTSLDDAVRCFTDGFDCDHHPGAGRGVEWGDGVFMTTFGWGMPGGIDRSEDGIVWERVLPDTTFGGIVYGNGIWLAAARRAQWSDDDGTTWNEVDDTAMTGWNVRRAAFVPAEGGRFVMVADGETVVSEDAQTWSVPSVLPESCGAGIQTRGGIAYGNGVITVMGGGGNVCWSDDGGNMWTASSAGGDITSHLVWDGQDFVAWGRGMVYRSSDGATWTSSATVPDNLNLGPTAFNPDTGTYVGVRGGWQTWYEMQEFYRSSDGVNWETLPGENFSGSHPIRDIAVGWTTDPTVCE